MDVLSIFHTSALSASETFLFLNLIRKLFSSLSLCVFWGFFFQLHNSFPFPSFPVSFTSLTLRLRFREQLFCYFIFMSDFLMFMLLYPQKLFFIFASLRVTVAI